MLHYFSGVMSPEMSLYVLFCAEGRARQGEEPVGNYDAVYSKGFHIVLLHAVGRNINVLSMEVLDIWHGLILCNNTEVSVKQNSVLLHASHFLQYLYQ